MVVTQIMINEKSPRVVVDEDGLPRGPEIIDHALSNEDIERKHKLVGKFIKKYADKNPGAKDYNWVINKFSDMSLTELTILDRITFD